MIHGFYIRIKFNIYVFGSTTCNKFERNIFRKKRKCIHIFVPTTILVLAARRQNDAITYLLFGQILASYASQSKKI